MNESQVSTITNTFDKILGIATKVGSVVSLLLLALSAYIGSQLLPFAARLDRTDIRVSALEGYQDTLATQESVDNLSKRVDEYAGRSEKSLQEISQRLDKVIFR